MTDPNELPRLKARFQPQQWIHDNAVDSGPSVEFDITEEILRFGHEGVRVVYEEADTPGADFDDLAIEAGMLEQHDGPFRVMIDKAAMADFFRAVGVEDVSLITEDDLQRIRGQYGLREPVRMLNGQAYVLDENGYITADVRLDIDDIVGVSLEDFLDKLSVGVTGDELLSDISYKATGVDDQGSIVLSVTGDPALSLEVFGNDADEAAPGPSM